MANTAGGACSIYYANLATDVVDSISNFNNEKGVDIFPKSSDVRLISMLAAGGTLYFSERKIYSGVSGADTESIGAIGGRTYDSSLVILIGQKAYFLFQWSNGNTLIYYYNYSNSSFNFLKDCGANTTIFNLSINQKGISYDGSDVIYFILEDTGDNLKYLYSYIISTNTITKNGELNVSLMLDRNNDGTTIPFILEKGFHLTEDKIYQIPSVYVGRLNLISTFDFTDTVIAITDHYIFDDGGKVYEIINLIESIFEGLIHHSRNYFPSLKMRYNSDNITIIPQMFIQIIGPYTVDGSTTANQVTFEGIAIKPTKGRIQYVLVENQGSEMNTISPRGNKSGRSDEIITDINDDGAPDGPNYIRDGILANGGPMGTLDLSGAKLLRTVYNDLAEHDTFLWSLRPQGTLDYNAGGIDSGADLRYDGSGNLDAILQVLFWTIPKLNQIIVNGAINSITGEPYTGIWNDEVDQQLNGINPITIEDAQLNSDTLCQAKADTMGGNESTRTRGRFKFRKITYGLIQPGQTITFKYVVANYILITEAQYILDRIIMNIKTGVGHAEISSGL